MTMKNKKSADLSFKMTLLLMLSFIENVNSQAVMGIDFGSEFIKTSVVTLSKPVETVLDRDSSRKTPAYIGVKDDRIVFAETAKNLLRRNPESVVRNVYQLLGRYFDDPSIVEYRKLNPYVNITKDPDNGGILINFPKSNASFKPIEILCFWLDEIKQYTSVFIDYDIADALLVYDFTLDQAKADAIVAAAGLSSLNLMEISDSSRSVVTQYVVTRKKFLPTTPAYIMFVDVGATSTVVTVAKVAIANGTKANQTIPSFNITGVGFSYIGASDYDYCIKNFFIEDFKKKYKVAKDLTKDHKVDFKFLQEATNVKKVLTSSKEARVTVEDAYDFKTYQTAFKRTEMENICSNVTQRLGMAIDHSLLSADISVDNISDVVLMGGASLIPAVQELIQTKIKRAISRVLNTDESNAAGGSILAAKAHKLFRVAEIHTPSFVYYPIEIEYEVPVNNSDGQIIVKHNKEILYPHMSKQISKRVLIIHNVTDDFVIRARYSQSASYINTEKLDYRDIMDVYVNGIKELVANHSNYILRQVMVHFRFNTFKILTVTKVDMIMDKNETQSIFGKMGNVVRNMFGINEKSNQTIDNSDDTIEHIPSNSTNSTQTNKTTEDSKSRYEQNITLTVSYNITLLYFKPPNSEELDSSKSKLQQIYHREKLRNLNAQSRSDLEGLIYKTERSIEAKEWVNYTKEEEHESIINTTSEVKAWFEGHGYNANFSVLNSKLHEIRKAIAIAEDRIVEEKERSDKVLVLLEAINRTQTILSNTFQRQEILAYLNKTLVTHVYNLTLQTKEWLEEKLIQQKLLKPYDDTPALTIGMLRRKHRELDEAGMLFYQNLQKSMTDLSKDNEKRSKTNTTETSKTNTTETSKTVNETVTNNNETITNTNTDYASEAKKELDKAEL